MNEALTRESPLLVDRRHIPFKLDGLAGVKDPLPNFGRLFAL